MSGPTISSSRERHPRPAPGAPRPYHFPRFTRSALGNGMRLVVAPITKLPLVTVTVLVDAGAVADVRGRAGVAHLTAKLLLEGTTTRDGAAVAEAFERLGASIEARADWDATMITVTALAHRLEEALALVGEVIRTPAFSGREVERLRAERLADLLQLRAEPRGLADEMFSRLLYQPMSRFAEPDAGDEDSVAAITREDIVAHYAARFTPPAVTLVAAGDVTAAVIRDMAERVFGDWRGAAAKIAPVTDEPARRTRAVHIVSKPDAAQSELRIGHVGISRMHPEYFAVMIMNAVLGGLFSSRINLNLREAHGYTYGAQSYFDWRRERGPWIVSTAVQSDVTDAAAREVIAEIERIRQAPIARDELSLATSYLDGVFPIRYETTAAIAAALATLVVYDLPSDWFDRYRDRVRAVTERDVLRAAERYLHPDQLQMVVVGNAAAVRDRIAGLEFGSLHVYDANGQPT